MSVNVNRADLSGSNEAKNSKKQSLEDISTTVTQRNHIGPPCTCKEKCFTKLGEMRIKNIFEYFNNIEDKKLKTAYLQNIIICQPVKRKRKKEENKRKFHSTYTVEFHEEKFIVCKTAFVSIHGITKWRVEAAIQSKCQEKDTIDCQNTNPITLHQRENIQENIDPQDADSMASKTMDYFIGESADRSEQNFQDTDASHVSSTDLHSIDSCVMSAETPVYTKKGRIRTSKPETWANNVRKRLRNSGQSYKTRRNKDVPSRKIGNPCTCKMKCFNRVGLIGVKTIFQAYWNTGDYNLQTAYLQKMINQKPIKRKRTKKKDSVKKKL